MHQKSKRFLRICLSFALLAAIIIGIPLLELAFGSVRLLIPSGAAVWIRPDEPVSLNSMPKGTIDTVKFCKDYNSTGLHGDAELTVRAMGVATVEVDGRQAGGPADAWERPLTTNLLPFLSPGTREICVKVENPQGPAVMLARSESLGLFTGKGWWAYRGSNRLPTVGVDAPANAPMARYFGRSGKALLSELPFLIPIFLAVFAWTMLYYGNAPQSLVRRLTPGVNGLRLMLTAAWIVIAVNNFWKLPTYVGFDVAAHLDYIIYVAEHRRIPLAGEGWQAFQSPLYYMVSAPVFFLIKTRFAGLMRPAARILRIIPIICGALQVEISYRFMRYAAPERRDLQAIGVMIGGLLPMNLYLSQSLSNEPMCALFTAAALTAGLSVLKAAPDAFPLRRIALFGVFLGLALLSKVTAALLLFPAAFLFAYRFSGKDCRVLCPAKAASIAFGIAFAIAGWYYVRNWIYLGRPFVGGWESVMGWQYPGYRTLKQFYGFGDALFHPVYSGLNGFWDSIYSTFWLDGFLSSVISPEWIPPWNYGVMLAGAWLALVPTFGILAGMAVSIIDFRESLRNGAFFAVLCVAIYYAALLSLYLKLPVYSTAKASYTSGLTPLYAFFGATGLGRLMRNGWMRAVIYGLMACWAVYAYAAYFVI